jgi:hypothetical protein
VITTIIDEIGSAPVYTFLIGVILGYLSHHWFWRKENEALMDLVRQLRRKLDAFM